MKPAPVPLPLIAPFAQPDTIFTQLPRYVTLTVLMVTMKTPPLELVLPATPLARLVLPLALPLALLAMLSTTVLE